MNIEKRLEFLVSVINYFKKCSKLKFNRDEKLFNEYNKLYTGQLISLNPPEHFYLYLTFNLTNDGEKILLKEIKCSIYNFGDQQSINCEILERYPKNDIDQTRVDFGASPPPFPTHYNLIGQINKKEIPGNSSNDYFLPLKCNGFQIDNLEGIDLTENPNATFIANVSHKLEINFITSKGEIIDFETMIWTRTPTGNEIEL